MLLVGKTFKLSSLCNEILILLLELALVLDESEKRKLRRLWRLVIVAHECIQFGTNIVQL